MKQRWTSRNRFFFYSKIQSQAIQSWYENLALIPIVGKSAFISHTKHSGSNKHGSISFIIDNMHCVIFRIWEQDNIPRCDEIQNKRLEVLGNTFNLHSNSTLHLRSVVSQSVSMGE